MSRPRTGTIITRSGVFYARVRFTDADGQSRAIERRARSRSHARQLVAQLLVETRERIVIARDLTFEQLSEAYLRERVQPAVYSGDRKVAGMRAHRNTAQEVRRLCEYWNPWRLADITHAAIDSYKRQRLATKNARGTERKISGLNHELRRLRAMLNFAIQNRWLQSNPFHHGPAIISPADEIPRDRPRGKDEEEALLAQCIGQRAHLRPILICALHTAMRHSEILRLERRDVDLEARIITVRATVSKTATERLTPISDRLAFELERILDVIDDAPDAKIFGGIKSVRKAFENACSDAKITGLTFHDLRHWATTDLVNSLAAAGLPPQHAQKITGHTQEKTFRRYVRTDRAIVDATRQALEALRKTQAKKEK